MKKILFFLLGAAMTCSMVSCGDDDDNLLYVSLATVEYSQGSPQQLLFMLNDSTTLRPVNFRSDAQAGKRILISYELGRNYGSESEYRYDVRIENWSWVLTKSPIDLTSANEAGVGNDPFYRVLKMSSGGGYLNVWFQFLYDYSPHYINLVNNTITPPLNEGDTINLELRQNAYNSNQGFVAEELVSFNLNSYLETAAQAGKTKLVVGVKTILFNGVTNVNYVTFNVGRPNPDDGTKLYLEGYHPQDGALN